jgi:hypothetical protein
MPGSTAPVTLACSQLHPSRTDFRALKLGLTLSLPGPVIQITTPGFRWWQRAFLGNPELGVGSSPIHWVKFAEACNSKGYAIKEPIEVRSKMDQAMKERKPTILLKETHTHHVDNKCQGEK